MWRHLVKVALGRSRLDVKAVHCLLLVVEFGIYCTVVFTIYIVFTNVNFNAIVENLLGVVVKIKAFVTP